MESLSVFGEMGLVRREEDIDTDRRGVRPVRASRTQPSLLAMISVHPNASVVAFVSHLYPRETPAAEEANWLGPFRPGEP